MKPVALLCALLLAACSSGTRTVVPAHRATAIPQVTTTKVVTIVLENHSDKAALEGMPYLKELAQTYGRTSEYKSLAHPSLPNYLAMAAGSTFGITDDLDPKEHALTGQTVFDSGDAAVYAEGMTVNCQEFNADRYVVRHNAWSYFAGGRASCLERDKPLASLDSAVLPTVSVIIPDLCNDAHDCGLDKADGFLQTWVPKLMASPDYVAGRLAVVVTFDEVEHDSEGNVLTTVVAPKLKGTVVDAPLSHLAWCRWMTDLEGAPALRDAARTTSLGVAFGLT
jgi:hypothetical protein